MVDDSQNMADMNWRLVEDARDAMARNDWMLALSLFEQSRRICINEGWRDGVHYADDMILDIYPNLKHQIDDSNRFHDEKPVDVVTSQATMAAGSAGDDAEIEATPVAHVFDEDRSSRRLRRLLNAEKE